MRLPVTRGIVEGWIKIYRKFEKWEWRDKPEMVSLFLHILTQANFERSSWHGILIERGQCIFGRLKWAETLGISERSLRTCIERLKSTSEVTIKTTNKFSLITVVNYEEYQEIEEKTTSKTTSTLGNDRPATDQQSTTPKEVKKKKKKEKVSSAGAQEPKAEEPKTEYEVKLDEFISHRKDMKKPFTANGEKNFRKKLNRLHTKGYDILRLMDEAMEKNWLTIYTHDDQEDAA